MTNDLIGGVRYNRFTPTAQVCDYPYVAGNVNTTFSDHTNIVMAAFSRNMDLIWYITEKQFHDEVNRHTALAFRQNTGTQNSYVAAYDPVRKKIYGFASLARAIDADGIYVFEVSRNGKIQYLKRLTQTQFSYDRQFFGGGACSVHDGNFIYCISAIPATTSRYRKGSVDSPEGTNLSSFVTPSGAGQYLESYFTPTSFAHGKIIFGWTKKWPTSTIKSQTEFYQIGYADVNTGQFIPVFTNNQQINVPDEEVTYKYLVNVRTNESMSRIVVVEDIITQREGYDTLLIR